MISPHELNATATRTRAEREVSDGKGGWMPLPPEEVEIHCRIRPADRGERETVARLEGRRVDWMVYLLPDDDTRRGDVLEVRGRTLEVIAIREPSEPEFRVAETEERQT